ncbi:hypothetical protein Q7P37_009069 [Cladosporium fusiforme]
MAPPITFLDCTPFAELALKREGHIIDGHPIRIASPCTGDDFDPLSLVAADGVATLLYHWSPDALRAFLDRDRFYSCEWICTMGSGFQMNVLRIFRKDRRITLSMSSTSWQVLEKAVFRMPPNGQPWVPLCAVADRNAGRVFNVPITGSLMAAKMVSSKPWHADDAQYSFRLTTVQDDKHIELSGRLTDPHWLYAPYTTRECTYCSQSFDLRWCSDCEWACYCSDRCEIMDQAVHKTFCDVAPRRLTA